MSAQQPATACMTGCARFFSASPGWPTIGWSAYGGQLESARILLDHGAILAGLQTLQCHAGGRSSGYSPPVCIRSFTTRDHHDPFTLACREPQKRPL
jgi:hypothetical protein